MNAILIKDVEYTTSKGDKIVIPENTIFILDLKRNLGYFEVRFKENKTNIIRAIQVDVFKDEYLLEN